MHSGRRERDHISVVSTNGTTYLVVSNVGGKLARGQRGVSQSEAQLGSTTLLKFGLKSIAKLGRSWATVKHPYTVFCKYYAIQVVVLNHYTMFAGTTTWPGGF